MAQNANKLISSLTSPATVNFAISVDKYLGVEEDYIKYLRSRDRFFFSTQVSQQHVVVARKKLVEELKKEDPLCPSDEDDQNRRRRKQGSPNLAPILIGLGLAAAGAAATKAIGDAFQGIGNLIPKFGAPKKPPAEKPLELPVQPSTPKPTPAPVPVPSPVTVPKPPQTPVWKPTEFEKRLMEQDKPAPISAFDPAELIAGGAIGKVFQLGRLGGFFSRFLPKAAPAVQPGSKIVPFVRPQVPAANNITRFSRQAVPRFAEGGLVSKPTNALVGEGGEPEVIVPMSKLGDSLSGPTKQLGALLTGLAGSFVGGFPIASPAIASVQGDIAKSRRKFGEDKNAARLFGGGKIGGLTDQLFKVFTSLSGVGMIGEAIGKVVGLVKEPPMPPPGPESGDFWLLAVAALYENSDPQGAADVAQAIYNRVANPGWGKSIREVILAPNQFQPTRQYGGVQEWSTIVDENSAKAFVQRHGKTPQMLDTVAAALRDPAKQQSARAFVGPRDNFRADSYERANNHLEDSTEVSRLGHTFGMEAGGANYAAFKAGTMITGSVPTFTSSPGGPTPIGTPPTSGQGWTLNSPRGYRWHPVTGQWKFHNGVDISGGGSGAPMYTRFPAQVVHAGWKDDGYGYSVVLRYSNGAETRWGHMLQAPNVRTGQTIQANTLLGLEGSTGMSTGPHLHLELYPRGNAFSYAKENAIDPLPYANQLLYYGSRRGSSGGSGGGRSVGGGKVNLSPVGKPEQNLESNPLNSMGTTGITPMYIPIPIPIETPPQIIPIPVNGKKKSTPYVITSTNKATRVR